MRGTARRRRDGLKRWLNISLDRRAFELRTSCRTRVRCRPSIRSLFSIQACGCVWRPDSNAQPHATDVRSVSWAKCGARSMTSEMRALAGQARRPLHHRRTGHAFKNQWVRKVQTRLRGRSRVQATCWRGGRPLGNGPTRRPNVRARLCLNSSRPSAQPPFVAARKAVMNSSSSLASQSA